jgi:TolA-binding protein
MPASRAADRGRLGEALKKGGDLKSAAEEFEQAYQGYPQNNTCRMDYETSGAT